MNYPSTITHPSAFQRGQAADFDGVFDWSFTQGCFGETRITPMDFDGVVERHGQFLIFETKDVGAPIKEGQFITLAMIHRLGRFSLLFIEGKTAPEQGVLFTTKHEIPPQSFSLNTDTRCKSIQIGDIAGGYRWVGVNRATKIVADWFKWASDQ